jgi:hypothetical protein
MTIKDSTGNILDKPDLTAGHLEPATETIHHDAVKGVEEVSHLETVAEYPGGGKEVRRFIDTPGVEAAVAWDETVSYQLYTPYTDAEVTAQKIDALKAQLFATDYVAAKIAEGAATKDDYAAELKQRQTWRDEINELEGSN